MITFVWNSKYEDPMQATIAVHNRKPLPRIPAPGRTKKANEMHPISLLNEPNCKSTRTPRLPLSILNRSTRSPPTLNSNAKRTETASLPHIGNLPSLYSHSNHSGDLLSGSRSPIAQVRSTPTHSITTHLDRQRIPLQIQRRLPPTSLLRSRRKLWKKYWLVVDLATIPELSENMYEIEIESVHQVRSRSGNSKLSLRKTPPSELQSIPTVTPIVRPSSKPRVVTMPPPPELDDDTGSESSSSDEDLDAYEFDLSCMEPNSVDLPTGIYDKPEDSRFPQHSNSSVRVANHLETDISSIYESISRRNLTRIPL